MHLLLTGVAAQRHAERYGECYPHLRDRIHVHALNDLELQCLYRKALAVVVPSRREGFGLPVLEAMASGGRVLTMDVAGLREAASGAVPCLDPEDAHLLRLWLELLLDAPSKAWLMPHLVRRRRARLERLDPDLLGLTLLRKPGAWPIVSLGRSSTIPVAHVTMLKLLLGDPNARKLNATSRSSPTSTCWKSCLLRRRAAGRQRPSRSAWPMPAPGDQRPILDEILPEAFAVVREAGNGCWACATSMCS